ncbi:E3 ubiquitin-protein ligase ubr1 [Stygiomarasmius scandens]|uniref:E3 ubiquitin-protein ligase n=1 Tax=Marasmiellus scandens TaxID=2682957 RepID=A0ABR1JC86_9AGAR
MSFSISRLFPSTNKSSEPLSHLRFVLETMPGSKKYVFTPSTRAEVLAQLYDAFWGSYSHLFLPPSCPTLPHGGLLAQVQLAHGYYGAGKDESPSGRPCGHILKKGEPCYRCKDCALDDSCVVCSRCFHATNHTGHNVSFFIAQQSGGCCDCGDEEAWRVDIQCPFHPITDSTTRSRSTTTLPPDLHDSISRTIAYALDFLLDTLDFSPDEPSVPTHEADLRLQPSSDPMMKDQYCVLIWNDDKHSFDEVIKLLMDLPPPYTFRTREEAAEVTLRIDENGREVVAMGTEVSALLNIASNIAQIDLGVTVRRAYDTFREQISSVIIEWLLDLTSVRLGSDTLVLREIIAQELLSPRRRDLNNSSYMYTSGGQFLHSLPDIPNLTRLDTLFLGHTRLWKKPRLSLKEIYTSILTLSKDHKLAVAGHFARVYHRIIDAYLLVDREAETSIKYFALQLFTVPSVSLHIVRQHKLITRLLSIITAFFTNQIDEKRIKSSSSGLSGLSVGGGATVTIVDVDTFPFKSKRFMPVFSDLRYLCSNPPVQALIAASSISTLPSRSSSSSSLPYPLSSSSNKDNLLLQFIRTCTLFMCINPNKRASTTHVEFETDSWISVFNVTLSLSRVIKVFGGAYKYGSTEALVGAIQSVLNGILVCVTVGLPGAAASIAASSPSSSSSSGSGSGTNEEGSPTVSGPGSGPTKFHFEPITFHTVPFGSFTADGTETERKWNVIKFDVSSGWISFHHSLHWLFAELMKHTELLTWEKLELFGITPSTLSSSSQNQSQSPLTPLLLTTLSPPALLTILDFPLRVLSMIAQIRTGLWVRNGFGIRGQVLHYRDFMLRELCFDQDLWVVQVALVALGDVRVENKDKDKDGGGRGGDLVLVSVLERFGLREFFLEPSQDEDGSDGSADAEGVQVHVQTPFQVSPTYADPSHLGSMIEELFYILITTLSEYASASSLPIEEQIRREIIHGLALGPSTYSELVKRVSERLVEDVEFERVLRAGGLRRQGEEKPGWRFKPPESTTDVGMYELVDDDSDSAYDPGAGSVWDEVNPWFFHYTRNKREEVEGVLKARILRKHRRQQSQKKGEEEPVLVPRRMPIPSNSPYVALPAAFESEVLMQIMFFAVWNVVMETDADALAKRGASGAGGVGRTGTPPPSGEAILDQVLHLIMLGIVERGKVFCVLAASRAFHVRPTSGGGREEKTLLDVLCKLEYHETYTKAYKPRVGWILDKIAEYVPNEVQSRRGGLERFRSGVKPGVGGADQGPGTGAGGDPEEARKRAAKARQEAIMAQMKAQQESFAINFGDGEDDDDDDEDESLDQGHQHHQQGDGDHVMEDVKEEQVSYGTCIVCQEDLVHSRAFGMLGLVQPSRLIRRQPDGFASCLNEVLISPSSLDKPATPLPGGSGNDSKPTFPPPDAEELDAKAKVASSSGPINYEGFPAQYTRFGLHASVCSHMMHLDCFQVYIVSIRQRHRSQATRNHPEVIPRKEYICPLCKSLGNVILPVHSTTGPFSSSLTLNGVAFSDWIRGAGISILKSKPDTLLESLQFRNGTGEFVFWSAQDSGYGTVMKSLEKESGGGEALKMVDSVMTVAKSLSQQTRHLRERHEPEAGERGAGIYLPEELVGYTIASIEIAQRGMSSPTGLMVDHLPDAQMQMIRGSLNVLTRLAAIHFKGRQDEGRDAVKQAIIKRLLPEWSRSSLTSFSFPLLLRDPFTVLVETSAVAPDIIKHVLVLTYYACLARTVIGLVFVLNKIRSYNTAQLFRRSHQDIFGDVRMFFMSVVRHSPVFEHTATLAFETFGEARIEKLLYAFTLPFLRKAAILCRAVLPQAFPTPDSIGDANANEYTRLLQFLGIPKLADLPHQDTLQNALSGWCAHYGHSHAASPLNFGVVLDMPCVYRLARLPLVLDNLFVEPEKHVKCTRCNTVPADAAICLLCGMTVCFQSTCCADLIDGRGECNMHMRECGGALGIYFLVKRCIVLYLYGNSGTFNQSPYLDVHGEVDISMRRGPRQYLHHARWEDIRKTWLNHGIPTVITRKLESTLDSGGWETF